MGDAAQARSERADGRNRKNVVPTAGDEVLLEERGEGAVSRVGDCGADGGGASRDDFVVVLPRP